MNSGSPSLMLCVCVCKHLASTKLVPVRDDVAIWRHCFIQRVTWKNTPVLTWLRTRADTRKWTHALTKTDACSHMRTDVDRQLYLYQCSNKSTCSSVYFLWLWLLCSERQRRFNAGGREGRAVCRGQEERRAPHGIFFLLAYLSIS